MTFHLAKNALLERRADILGMKRDFSIATTGDELERLEHMTTLDIEARLATSDAKRLKEINAALKRIERGTYGFCLHCDAPILPARLKAIPEVAVCIRCAVKAERRSA